MFNLLSPRSSAADLASTAPPAVRIASPVSVHSKDHLSCCNRRSLSCTKAASKPTAVACDKVTAACMHVLRTHTSLRQLRRVTNGLRLVLRGLRDCGHVVHPLAEAILRVIRVATAHAHVPSWRIMERSHDSLGKVSAGPRPPLWFAITLRVEEGRPPCSFARNTSPIHAGVVANLLEHLEKRKLGNHELNRQVPATSICATDLKNSTVSCTEPASTTKRSCEYFDLVKSRWHFNNPFTLVTTLIHVVVRSGLCLSCRLQQPLH